MCSMAPPRWTVVAILAGLATLATVALAATVGKHTAQHCEPRVSNPHTPYSGIVAADRPMAW